MYMKDPVKFTRESVHLIVPIIQRVKRQSKFCTKESVISMQLIVIIMIIVMISLIVKELLYIVMMIILKIQTPTISCSAITLPLLM